ncbi:MAG: hypothetical protein PHF12_05715 [Candidatus Omnitrophica bacterium]|jgi:hypothetical protein|nr:hypothetical protein [Candidatus Omnitrophota bacterium]
MIYPGSCYEILQNMRYAILEHSEALVQGTDTTGAFQNSYLVSLINRAQNFLWSLLFKQMPELFQTSASLAFTSSLATLPWDCFKVLEILDADGIPMTRIDYKERHVANYTGSKYLYDRYGQTIRIDQDGVSETGTLHYYKRPRELTMGASSDGGALSLTLATAAKPIADYYNGMTIENVTDVWVDVIADYSAARAATLTSQTGAASKYYGIVSELPEEFHRLIEEKAVLDLKRHPKAPVKLTQLDLDMFNDNLSAALSAFAGTFTGDANLDEIFNDFEPIR